jgi:hypothetical protein
MGRKLELMPNSGHHYYFLPLALDDEKARNAAQIKKQYDIPDKTGLLGKLIPLNDGQWSAIDGKPWMRVKVAKATIYELNADGIAESYGHGIPAYGVWLAIETNTGTDERGYFYRSERNLAWPAGLKEDLSNLPDAPYVDKDTQYLKDAEFDLLQIYPRLAEATKGILEAFPFSIEWCPKRGNPFPVDLIVDFGNSRTVALLLEIAPGARGRMTNELGQLCRPLVFPGELQDDERGMFGSPPSSNYIVDSWFILRKPEFGHAAQYADNAAFSPEQFHTHDYEFLKSRTSLFWGKWVLSLNEATYRIPHMFVEMSPAAIGPGSINYFTNLGGAAVRCALSSPKRYAWDKVPVGDRGDVFWHMMLSTGNRKPDPLSGEIMAFMPPNFEQRFYSDSKAEKSPEHLMEMSPVEMDDGPFRNNTPVFPKSDGLVWSALTIIEQAHRSINRQVARVAGALPRRYLENIVVTFPSGWTQEEIDCYYRAWQYARNIFYWSRYRSGDAAREADIVPENRPPQVLMQLDEAVASQLPVIYSEVRHLGNDIKLWLDLFGRDRGGEKTCRVMSIDIGGGTLDTAVVEYSTPPQHRVQLQPSMLFTDSSTKAGDKLVKTIIDEVLIPYILERNPDAKTRAKLLDVLTQKGDLAVVNKRVALVKSVFIPIVVNWLTVLSTLASGEVPMKAMAVINCPGVDIRALDDFNRSVVGGGAPVLSATDPIDVQYKKLNEVVVRWISEIAEAHARYLAAFQCDLVVVTGKPSEINIIREILERELPIEAHRIIFVKGYYAGNWLPLGGSGKEANRIQDAKFVTAIGAALTQAFNQELLPAWSITKIRRPDKPLPNWWHQLNDFGAVVPGGPLLDPSMDTRPNIDVFPNMIIGRVRFPGSQPERVYIFRSKSGREYTQLKATLKRVPTRPDGTALITERLELVSVSGFDQEGQRIDPDSGVEEFELYLNTLGGNYWLDEPVFDIPVEA